MMMMMTMIFLFKFFAVGLRRSSRMDGTSIWWLRARIFHVFATKVANPKQPDAISVNVTASALHTTTPNYIYDITPNATITAFSIFGLTSVLAPSKFHSQQRQHKKKCLLRDIVHSTPWPPDSQKSWRRTSCNVAYCIQQTACSYGTFSLRLFSADIILHILYV